MSSAGDGHLYVVDCSGFVLQHLQQLQEQASEAGKGAGFLAAMAALYEHLRKDPMGFGEPLYRLPALELTVRVGVVLPLAVHFAVHDKKPVVFIKWIDNLSP
jgi:hypothetical protein